MVERLESNQKDDLRTEDTGKPHDLGQEVEEQEEDAEMAALIDALVDTHFAQHPELDDTTEDAEMAALVDALVDTHFARQVTEHEIITRRSEHDSGPIPEDGLVAEHNGKGSVPKYASTCTAPSQPASRATFSADTSDSLLLDVPFHLLRIEDNPPAYSADPAPHQGGACSTRVLSWAPPFNYGARMFYVVLCGRRCGIYSNWNFVASLVNGVPHNHYKGYRNLSDAHYGEEDTFGPLETAVDIP
ncbi:hypothetical protein CCMSSC00406_0006854 [Pleurotus cornucopiae]|uniref:Uncharacterized protein n=1 Tax=Pleurotus cornucopiae TaxID=5321 RepID=A0ACB7IPZ0_PLECO|nr:hypothetical protein CCMSSC00406_0006854 [Pleurotus cornucopiae]